MNYTIVRSKKARLMRISIYPNCTVKVTAPFLAPESLIRRFVSSKSKWIEKKLDHFKKHPISPKRLLLNSLGRKDFKEQKEKVLRLVKERLEYFNKHYGLIYHKITIRSQKSRWGSCSRNGNLSFNLLCVKFAVGYFHCRNGSRYSYKTIFHNYTLLYIGAKIIIPD